MQVLFKPEAYKKFRAYVNLMDYEISGFGKVHKEGENLIVDDIRIFAQTVNGGHTENWATAQSGEGYRKFWDDLAVEGEDFSKWRLWWHSHVNMNASFSGTDDKTIDGYDFEQAEDNWLLSIVTNKQGKLFCQLDVYQPFRMVLKDLDWDIDLEAMPGAELDAIKDEIAALVTIERPQSSWCRTHGKYHGNHDSGNTQIVYGGKGMCSIPRSPNYTSLSPEKRKEMAIKYPNLFPTLSKMMIDLDSDEQARQDLEAAARGEDWGGEEEWDDYMEKYYEQQALLDSGIEEGEVLE